MKYKTIYKTLCKRGQEARDVEYVEKHHILPRCLGGSNKKTNLTCLTPREHFIAHWLLTKIYPKDHRIWHAFGRMSSISPNGERKRFARLYEQSKKAHSVAMKLNNPMRNKKSVKKLSDTRKRLFQTGMLKPNRAGLKGRKTLSEQMKGNKNPVRRFPEKHNFAIRSYTKGTVWVINPQSGERKRVDPSNVPSGFIRGKR